MKKIILYLFFATSGIIAVAQTPEVDSEELTEKRQQKIQALYVAYITQQIGLTPEEAQKFWPVHAQYEAELKALNRDNTDELAKQQAILNIKKKYQTNFSKLLGNERCNNFYRKDGEFRKRMLERLKQIRQQRMRERNDGERKNKSGGRFGNP
jgi:lipase chaperone LimK